MSEGRTILAGCVGGWSGGILAAADKFVSVEETDLDSGDLDSGGVSFCCSSLGRRLLDIKRWNCVKKCSFDVIKLCSEIVCLLDGVMRFRWCFADLDGAMRFDCALLI